MSCFVLAQGRLNSPVLFAYTILITEYDKDTAKCYRDVRKEELLVDDFATTYLFVLVMVTISIVLFWWGIIYLIRKFLRSDSGMTREKK